MPAVKNVGEPCAGEPHARIDGGREETGTTRQVRAEPGASRLPDHPPQSSGPRLVANTSNASGVVFTRPADRVSPPSEIATSQNAR